MPVKKPVTKSTKKPAGSKNPVKAKAPTSSSTKR